MGQQLSSSYAPVGPSVQLQIVGGSYDGFFIGRYSPNPSLLTAVSASSATTFTLDQSSTHYVFVNDKAYSSGWAIPAITTATSYYAPLQLRNETDLASDDTLFSLPFGGGPNNPIMYGLLYTLSSPYDGAILGLTAGPQNTVGLCAAANNTLFIYNTIAYNLAAGDCGAGSQVMPALRPVGLPPPPSSSIAAARPTVSNNLGNVPATPSAAGQCYVTVMLYVTKTTTYVTPGYTGTAGSGGSGGGGGAPLGGSAQAMLGAASTAAGANFYGCAPVTSTIFLN